jgi:iron complex outermembrane receptor protein
MPKKREFMLNTGFGSGMAGNGAENTRRIAASYGDVFKDKFSFYINNDYQGTDGYISELVSGNAVASTTGSIPSYSSTGAATRILGDKGIGGAWQNNFTLKAEYRFNSDTKLKFTFLRSYGERKYTDPHTYMRNASGNPVWSTSGSQSSYLGSNAADGQFMYNLAFETVVSSAKIKANLNYLDQDTSWYTTASSVTTGTVATQTGGPGKYTTTPATAIGSDVQVTFPVSNWNLVTVGGAFRQSKLDGADYVLSNWLNENSRGQLVGAARGTDNTYAVFMQDEISVTDKLSLYAGFRQDWWQTSDGYVLASNSSNVITTGPTSFASRSADAFSPKGAIVYKPFGRTIFKISGGKAFRAPNNYELYRTTMMGSSTTYANNPDLKPEKSITWDASVSQGLWEGANIKVTYFENYFTDLIYSTTTGSTRYRRNAGKAESKGVEMEVEQKFGKMARAFFNYTYTDGKITENSAVPASVGKKMTDIPEHMFNLGADAEYGPFGIMFIGRYMGKRYGNDTNNDVAKGVPGVYDAFFTGMSNCVTRSPTGQLPASR